MFLIVQNGTFWKIISNIGHGRLVTLCPEQQQQQSCQKKTLSVEKLLIFFAFYKEIWKKQKYISMNGLKIFFKTGVKACSISSSGCCCANTIEARFTTNGENAARNSKS
jgi:hypothetical protein